MPIFNQGSGGGGGGLSPIIVVSAPTGSTITCKKGSTTLTATESAGTWSFAIPAYGTWTVVGVNDGTTEEKTVEVTAVEVYFVTMKLTPKLNDVSWEQIKAVSSSGQGANYWAIGDCKQITINGKLSDGLTLSNYNTWVYIIGFDHNSEKEGTGIAFQGFKTAQFNGIDICLCDSGYGYYQSSGQWFNISNNNSSSGGWNSCNIRNNILPVVKAALPSDLQAVIKTTTLYTDNVGAGSSVASYVTPTQDDLYLLAEYEIFGTRHYANTTEELYQKQYAYYVAGNSKVKYKHDSAAIAADWWERTVCVLSTEDFCRVLSDGSNNIGGPGISLGLAPAFKV